MTIIEARLNKIKEERKSYLEELDKEGVTEERVAQIEGATKTLDAEERTLRLKMDVAGKITEPEGNPQGSEPNATEARNKQIQESGEMVIAASEVRSALGTITRSTVIGTDTLTQPTKAGDTIRDNLNMVSSIVDQVYSQDLTGCSSFEEPYVKTDSVASNKTDGTANTASDPVFRVAKLQPYLLNVTSYVSKNIERVTPTAYVEKVKSLAIKALRRKAADLIVNGVAGSFNGIKIAKNTKEEVIAKTYKVTSNTIGATTLRDIVFQYGGNDELGPNARLFLTKEDLAAFGAVRGTNEKKAVYDITADSGNANTGVIKDGGTIVPYTIMSGLTTLSTATRGAADIPTMVYGDPMNFEIGLFGPYTVEVSKDYKFAEGLLTIMGECMVGGNVIVDQGFIIVTLEKTA